MMPPEAIDRFEKLFQEWAQRPPVTPADEAARRVLRRLPTVPGPRPFFSWIRIAATAAVVLPAVLATHFYLRRTPVSPVPQDAAIELVGAPLVPEGVVLIWLDSETPLYFTLNPPAPRKGDPTS